MSARQKVAVVGAGAIGLMLGAAFARRDHRGSSAHRD